VRSAEEIAVSLTGEGVAVLLRPSLRCALNLADRPGGFPALIHALQDGSLTACCDVLRAAGEDRPFLEDKVMVTHPDTLKAPLTAFALACTGIDMDAPQDSAPKGKPVPFKDHLAQLYRYGTGWLGWDPETTLDATPHQISEAMKGRMELLKAVFGGSEAEEREPVDLGKRAMAVFGSMNTTVIPRRPAA
jgi:hypothetical protein